MSNFNEEMVSLHAIYCDCERCKEVRKLQKESCQASPYFRSPKKGDDRCLMCGFLLAHCMCHERAIAG